MKSLKNGEQYLEVSFEKLELSENSFKDIEFEECHFSDCDLSGVQLQNCKFVSCEFARCNLSLASFPNARLFGVSFQDSKLVGIDWTRATWPVYYIDFELKFQRCILNDASFFGLTLNELTLDECKLHDVDFREGNFASSTRCYCDFTHSLFMRTNLQKVDFSESTNYAINVLENQVKGAKFSRYEALNLLECLGIELVD
ncbi:pentapeptide repeat-containing protein [Vibrio cholerae]|nr:pentapeptide repeat-containing protein [Vibrio cholerae]EKF9678228.1 pentapeptide repeat-containing protein [Vibrio cholerae]